MKEKDEQITGPPGVDNLMNSPEDININVD
jgi:hypothetical protein